MPGMTNPQPGRATQKNGIGRQSIAVETHFTLRVALYVVTKLAGRSRRKVRNRRSYLVVYWPEGTPQRAKFNISAPPSQLRIRPQQARSKARAHGRLPGNANLPIGFSPLAGEGYGDLTVGEVARSGDRPQGMSCHCVIRTGQSLGIEVVLAGERVAEG